MFTHNIYRNIRTRVIVVRDGKMLLFPPGSDGTGRDPYRGPPGGGMKPNESLYECGEREVMEEMADLQIMILEVTLMVAEEVVAVQGETVE